MFLDEFVFLKNVTDDDDDDDFGGGGDDDDDDDVEYWQSYDK